MDLHSLCVCGGPKKVKRCVFWSSINNLFRAPLISSLKSSNQRIFHFWITDLKVNFAHISKTKGGLEIQSAEIDSISGSSNFAIEVKRKGSVTDLKTSFLPWSHLPPTIYYVEIGPKKDFQKRLQARTRKAATRTLNRKKDEQPIVRESP